MTPAPAPPGPAAPPRPAWVRLLAVAAFAAGAAALVVYEARRDLELHGDGWEYWYQAESFHRHGTPDLQPGDREAVDAEAAAQGFANPYTDPYAYSTAPDGRRYGVHFWAYALSAVPAKEALRRAGVSELVALPVANAAWFVLAVGVALFGSAAPVGQRLALVALAAVGPAVWYLKWTGAELFSWALALMAVVAYRDGRYGWAGAAAGLAATQNPTLVFVGGSAVLAAAWARRWRAAVGAAVGTGLGLVPYAFFQYHFGVPNLIAAEFATVRNLSWVRTWGLLTDVEQGLLPYAPVLVLALAAGVVRLVVTRNVPGLLLAAGGAAMAVGVQVGHNWNSDCAGLMRYLLWMVPVAAGVAVEGIGGDRRAWRLAAVAGAVHAALLVAYDQTDAIKEGYLKHTLLGEWVLTHCPRAYWPEPEVFVERQLVRDDWPHTPADLPVAYVRPDGTVSKALLDPGSVPAFAERFETDPGYLAELTARAAREDGLFYTHPPDGAARVREPVTAK